MRTKTKLKAGPTAVEHNGLRVKTNLKAGPTAVEY